MNQAVQEPNTIVIDGFIIDQETGEILGHAGVKPQFQVNDQASLEWVLERILNAEAEVKAVDQTPAVIAARAILENSEKIKAERTRRVDWLRTRFSPEIGEYLKTALTGKSRSLKTIFGTVGLRTVKGGLRVKDEEAALECAKVGWPNAVVTTEKFQISKLTDDQKSNLIRAFSENSATAMATVAFEVKPDVETIKIDTGAE